MNSRPQPAPSDPTPAPSAPAAGASAAAGSDPGSPPGPVRDPRGRRRGRIAALVLGAVVLVLLGGYLVGYLIAGDRLPRDARVAGVAVGGLDPGAAVERLRQELGDRAARPIAVTVGGTKSQVDPAAAGLGVDYEQSVARAGGGRSLDPRAIWQVLTGGSDTDPVLTQDAARLDRAVTALAAEVDRPARDAGLRYEGTTVQTRAAVDGIALSRTDAPAALRRAYLGSGGAVALKADLTPAAVTTAEAKRVAADFARPAVSGPVTVDAGRRSFEVTPKMIARSVVFAAADGTLTGRLDPDKLRDSADAAASEVELTKPRDATVRLRAGKPVVVPAVDGTTILADDLAAAVTPALTKTGRERQVEVKLAGRKAAFSTADAERLGVKRVIGEFTTYYPYAEYRNVNIGRAAEKINGTLLRPGQVFSLNRIVGERTRANGFVEGFIIKGSRFRKDLGGGVSQSATTTFNAMFFAGLQDIQHQPHGLYIDRYPPGREATVAWPSLDLKFRNNTDYGVLVQAYVKKASPGGRGSITVKMWSTKTWDDVRSSKLRRSNFTTGREITDDGAKCEPTEPVQGFDVNYERLFYRDGRVVKREPFRWRYAPTDKVTCKG